MQKSQLAVAGTEGASTKSADRVLHGLSAGTIIDLEKPAQCTKTTPGYSRGTPIP